MTSLLKNLLRFYCSIMEMGGKHVLGKGKEYTLGASRSGIRTSKSFFITGSSNERDEQLKKDGLKSRSVTDPKFKSNLSIDTAIAGNT